MQDEFESFEAYAVPLSEFVIEDMSRIAERKVIHSVDKWKQEMDPASTVIEALSIVRNMDCGSIRNSSLILLFEITNNRMEPDMC